MRASLNPDLIHVSGIYYGVVLLYCTCSCHTMPDGEELMRRGEKIIRAILCLPTLGS